MLFDFADQIPAIPAHTTKPARLLAAATAVLPLLTAGRPVTTATLADILTAHCGGTDAQGFWQWKDAYEVLEIAQVRFLQKFAPALHPLSPEQLLVMLEKLVQLCPTHTKRSDDSARLQQFSTPAKTMNFMFVLPLALPVQSMRSNLPSRYRLSNCKLDSVESA